MTAKLNIEKSDFKIKDYSIQERPATTNFRYKKFKNITQANTNKIFTICNIYIPNGFGNLKIFNKRTSPTKNKKCHLKTQSNTNLFVKDSNNLRLQSQIEDKKNYNKQNIDNEVPIESSTVYNSNKTYYGSPNKNDININKFVKNFYK